LKESVLRTYAGWTVNSGMAQKYVHYFGNEANEGLLEAHGLKPKFEDIDRLKPLSCPNCTELNKIDSKFCVKCRMVLSYDAYSETIQESKNVNDEITQLKEEFSKLQKTVTLSLHIDEQFMNQQGTQPLSDKQKEYIRKYNPDLFK